MCYENGEGVRKDADKAVEWYRKAAAQGHASAQHSLGVCYTNGEEAKVRCVVTSENAKPDSAANIGTGPWLAL